MRAEAERERASASPWRPFAWAGIVLGASLQLANAYANRSLWIDEAMLALNILGRSWTELLGPLWFAQAAPPLYLLLVRIVAFPFGGSEFGLRLVSLLAGLATLVLVWRIGRVLIGPEAAAWATWILALAAPIVHYANEVKPYQLDALAAVVLVGLAVRPLANGRGRVGLAAGGGLAVLLSYPAAFVLASIGLALAWAGIRRKDAATLRWAAGMGLGWLVLFAGVYLLAAQETAQSEFMQAFWRDFYLRPGEGFVERAALALGAVAAPLPVPGRFRDPGFLLLGAIVTVVFLVARRQGRLLGLLAGPLIVAACVSVLGLYPLRDRTLLFMAPLTAMLVVAAIVFALQAALPHRTWSRMVLVGLLVLPMPIRNQLGGPQPIGSPRNEREVVAFLDSRPSSDAVLLSTRSVPVWLYYTTDWADPDPDRLRWFASRFRLLSDSTRGADLLVHQRAAAGVVDRSPQFVAWVVGNGVGIRSDGQPSDEPYADWAFRTTAKLLDLRAERIWVYTGRERDAIALAGEWQGVGGRWRRQDVSEGRLVLELVPPARP